MASWFYNRFLHHGTAKKERCLDTGMHAHGYELIIFTAATQDGPFFFLSTGMEEMKHVQKQHGDESHDNLIHERRHTVTMMMMCSFLHRELNDTLINCISRHTRTVTHSFSWPRTMRIGSLTRLIQTVWRPVVFDMQKHHET